MYRCASLLSILSLITACGTAVPYQDSGVPNLRLSTTANSGTFLTATVVYLDIHRVTADCGTEYVGSLNLRAPLALRDPPAAIHLPEERLIELVFKFKTVGGNYSGLTSYATLLRPRAAHTYEATVTYDAGLYDVEIREIDPHGAPGRKIEHRSLSECRRV
jgi:hypothetical protein